jgi:hypothetical protein
VAKVLLLSSLINKYLLFLYKKFIESSTKYTQNTTQYRSMNTFFCSDYSRKVGEDLIGSATNCQAYVLVECPPPWTYEAFNSKWVPKNLRLLVEEFQQSKTSIKFLLIANNLSHKSSHKKILIYYKKEGFNNGYSKQEFQLENLEQAAGVIRKWLLLGIPKYEMEVPTTRDILVCTHGSHDQCCARYGNPFFFHATATVSNLNLENVRIWKSSHFGGHRFAPTAIDLPEGRYYGALDQKLFHLILTRSGDIKCLNRIYRGWGMLPPSIQVLERELIIYHGWDWFNYKVVDSRVVKHNQDQNMILAELTFEKPDGTLYTYQGEIIKYDTKNMQMKVSCNATKQSVCDKYAVVSLSLVSNKFLTCSTS